MEKENIHHNLEAIKDVALYYAKKSDYKTNYNIILFNPNEKGEFDLSKGSTYEFVEDSYFEKPRPNAIILFKTKEMLPAIAHSERPSDEEEVNRLLGGIEESVLRFNEYEKYAQDMDLRLGESLQSPAQKGKLKKGLAVHAVGADGVTYKQGINGLERIKNTNRNDKCNCESGKKFKNCCGKN